PEPFDAFAMLRVPPSGHGLMLLGVLVGLATPLARASLLAGWFARRGERAMVALSVLLVAIVLSGLLVRHHAAPPLSERSPPPEAREARSP
ncbi:MAG: hypothetical protein EBQ99_10380, partial [Planctomycetes bacterium]|nr:hypothetical protein [Planctomycetota bacterium]